MRAEASMFVGTDNIVIDGADEIFAPLLGRVVLGGFDWRTSGTALTQ